MHNADFSRYGDVQLRAPFDFSLESSIGCGGKAKIAFYPTNAEELATLVGKLETEGVGYYVLGNLTNVLPPDGGSEKVVISTKKMNGVSLIDNFVYAGASSGGLLAACKKGQRTGAEFLSGIPCTIGGALFMNAGADGRYISEIVESVTVLRAGLLLNLSKKDCRYAYKHSIFMENEDIIVGATLCLQKGTVKEIEEKTQHYIERRKHLPTGKSMGCVFKNPEGISAGALIEGSGLKGLCVGRAKISEKHANFILNEGGATAREIRALIKLIKNAVYAQYGVRLEEEIRYL